MRARIDWFVVVTALFLAVGCGGGGCGGCGGMEPIPGGFPVAKRNPNAGQIRVTPTALAKITADPAGVIGPLAGSGAANGVVTFPVPSSCGGSTEICCKNGLPDPNCGPIQINLNKIGADADRLVLTPQPQSGDNGRLDVQILARIKTVNDLSITYSGSHCMINLDTTRDNTPPDLKITTQIAFLQDAMTGTTRVVASNTNVTQLDSGDYSLSGDILCYIAGALVPPSVIEGQLAGPIENAINGATCKSCTTVADCGSPAATACTSGTCQEGNQCLQELGLDGRMHGSSLFASLSPGTTGALDIYEVAGGYSTTNNGGIALGLLGGMQPGGAARDKCGPSATAPALVPVTRATLFQSNQYNGTPFDVGIGIHQSQLDQLAYAGYDGGFLCLTIGSSFVSQLSTDTIGLLSRSLGKLVESNSPMAVGIRPQSPPTITLGLNTFKDDGSGNMVVDQPLLDIKFTALEIDFFASIDDQYNRVFTVVSDVHLPIGLQTTAMGQLTPVIGNPNDAFTNVSVKNSDAITESPQEIAGLFPTLLSLVLPQLSGGLSPISLPKLGGLQLKVTAVTAVGDNGAHDFLGIFGDLVPATMARAVDTHVEIVSIEEPSDKIARDVTQWRTANPPAVTLAMSGDAPDLEYSYRVDGGTWSAWNPKAKQIVSPRSFFIPGVHLVDVRARQIGHPETIDLVPERLELALGTGVPLEHNNETVVRTNDFHGQAGSAGCSCDTSGGNANGALFALVIGFVMLPMRRVRRRARVIAREAMRLGPLVWLVAVACLPGCSCGSDPCGNTACLPGDIDHALGRFTSVAGDDKRVLVATYDQKLGDLVVVDGTDVNKLKYTVVDGVPDTTPTHDPSTYRGGVEDPGENVGAWTSIAVSGTASVAYQDRDALQLKYAYETKAGGGWKSYTLDTSEFENGLYSSLTIDADKKPAIAYLALGIDDGMGHRMTELRLMRANTQTPNDPTDWTNKVITSTPGFCGGLCGSQSCVVGAAATDPEVCVSPTTDCTTACASTDVCVMGTCRAKVDPPKVLETPGGSGLYVNLLTLPDGRLAAVYYNKTRRALMLSVEASKNGNDFAETVLDGDVAGADRGMWASTTVGDDGTIHVAYQDALGDQLMYTSWNGGTAGTPVVVDDGQRPNDRTHPVGAGSSIYLVSGEPAIAYQDGLTSDVYLATRAGGTWTVNGLALGPLLDGFSIGSTSRHGTPVLAWGQLDPAKGPPPGLVVRTP